MLGEVTLEGIHFFNLSLERIKRMSVSFMMYRQKAQAYLLDNSIEVVSESECLLALKGHLGNSKAMRHQLNLLCRCVVIVSTDNMPMKQLLSHWRRFLHWAQPGP